MASATMWRGLARCRRKRRHEHRSKAHSRLDGADLHRRRFNDRLDRGAAVGWHRRLCGVAWRAADGSGDMSTAPKRIRVWTAPIYIGVVSTIGLIAALLSDGIGDYVAWLGALQTEAAT